MSAFRDMGSSAKPSYSESLRISQKQQLEKKITTGDIFLARTRASYLASRNYLLNLADRPVFVFAVQVALYASGSVSVCFRSV
jgi:hypothetical protein